MTQPRHDNRPIDEDSQFDLLVDGELDEAARRQLLRGLDDRPGGWRRCALAFLEAQSWKQELGVPGRKPETSVATPETAVARATSRPRRSLGRGSAILGMAASFLLAVGLTSLMRDLQRGGLPLGGGSDMAGMMAGSPTQAGLPIAGRLEPFGVLPGRANDMRLVHLRGRGLDGSVQTATLPVWERQSLDENWLRGLPTAIPREVSEAFEQSGHAVRSSRRLVPLAMPDGRRVVFPVDQLDVQYVGNPTYQ